MLCNMKRLLFPIMALLMLVACSSDEETTSRKEPVTYPSEISGVWTDCLLQDGAERNLTFNPQDMTASYYVNHFTDSIVFDNVTVPFTYDNQTGKLEMNFKGIATKESVSNISLTVFDDEYMLGEINYANPGQKPDTLLFTYLCEEFYHWRSTSDESYLSLFDDASGPESATDQMPALGWDNPFGGETVANGKSRSVTMMAMLTWVGVQLGTAAGLQVSKYAVDKILQQIFPDYDETGQNVKRIIQDMDVIKQKLDAIDEKIDQLAKQNRIAEATKNLTDRNDRYNELCISIQSALRQIDLAVQDSTNSAASDSTIIVNAVLEWGDGIYHNNKRTESADVYVAKSIQAYGNYSYPELYDIFAYETNDWECKGYEWREMLRTTDIALVSSAIELTALYWLFKCKINPDAVTQSMVKMHIQDLNTTLEKMEKLYTDKAVVRHSDQMISQISGFHLVFDKKIEWRDLSKPVWYPKSTTMPLSVEALVYGGTLDMSRIAKERFMTEKEFEQLNRYYYNMSGSLLNVLKEIGFDVNTTASLTSSKAEMVLPTGAYCIPTVALDRNDYVYFYAAINNTTRMKDVGVKVGEIYAPLITDGDWLLNFLKNQKYFSHYVNYEDHTWFNLRVLDR